MSSSLYNHHIHQGGLTRTIFTNESVNFTSPQFQTHTLKRQSGAKAFADVCEFQSGHPALREQLIQVLLDGGPQERLDFGVVELIRSH